MRELTTILARIRRSLRGGFGARLFVVLGLATLTGATAGLLPSVVGVAVDSILGRTRPPGGGAAGLFAGLLGGAPTWVVLLATLVTTLVTVGISVFGSQKGSALAGEVAAGLRVEMLRSVLYASPRDVEAAGRKSVQDRPPPPPGAKPPPGAAMPPGAKPPEIRGMEVVKLTIAREASIAADFIIAFMTGLPQTTVTLLVLGFELVTGGMGLVLAGGAALFLVSRLAADRASKRVAGEMQAMQRADTAVFATLGELLAATEDLRLLGARGQATREFAEAAYRSADARRRFTGALAVSGQIKSVFSALSPLLVLAAITFSRAEAPAGDVAKLLLVVPLLMARFEALDALRTGLIERGPVLRASSALLELPEFPPPPADPVPAGRIEGAEIRIEGVTYKPEGASRPILDGLSLVIPEGAVVGICGRSGCGKSTLVRLLLRLDDPSSGSISIGGVDLRRVAPADLPKVFSVLGQASRVLERTIGENLSVGMDPAPSEEAMREALRRVELDELASSSGSGEGRGLATAFRAVPPSLSGGEQRRLLLSRMLLREARVFVLDEPEAGLPSATAEQVLRSVAELAAGRTCVVVTHAPHLLRSTFNVVMDRGAVAATGTHEELLATSEIYQSLLAEGLKKSASAGGAVAPIASSWPPGPPASLPR
jgi:ABC-type multidrug transport system fused ATPase/permease subunit